VTAGEGCSGGWPEDFERLFGRLGVMEPRKARTLPQHGQFVGQVKWDGVRMLAFVTDKQVRLQNRNLRERTALFPEVRRLGSCLSLTPVILDGEFVVFMEGRPSFTAVLSRVRTSPGRAVAALRRHGPVTYCVFDVLYARGRDLRAEEWRLRNSILRELAHGYQSAQPVDPPLCHMHFTEAITDVSGLLDGTRQLGLEGIVVKELSSPYVEGKAHRFWWKLKHLKRQLAQIVGFSAEGSYVRSLMLGALKEGELTFIGSAGSGLNSEVARRLFDELSVHRRDVPPLEVPENVDSQAVWCEPTLAVEVEFLEWTPEGQLRHPVIVDFPRVPLQECVVDPHSPARGGNV
jgi:bifunctional non-homologous end joining protein LigD